ncbi:MAG: hypothetical protein H7Y03_01045 [Chitinophagaceae bacterium]|nr:hypothetical protein [Chitinophagaceae bacterium]
MNLLPLLNIFPKKVRVTFIDALTGSTINTKRILLAELPEAFNRPITMNIGDSPWRVTSARPARVEEYSISKKLLLQVQQPDTINPSILRYELPTMAPSLPYFTEDPLFSDFTLDLTPEQWRQTEFLPLEFLELIKEEMAPIEAILYPENETQNLLGFAQVHLRQKTDHAYLNIPFEKFCKKVQATGRGNILFPGKGYVHQGFAVTSESFCYYGILKEDRIQQLNLLHFECADEEFFNVLMKYDLVLADWCHGGIIGA